MSNPKIYFSLLPSMPISNSITLFANVLLLGAVCDLSGTSNEIQDATQNLLSSMLSYANKIELLI